MKTASIQKIKKPFRLLLSFIFDAPHSAAIATACA
jgi:hypothetical protein